MTDNTATPELPIKTPTLTGDVPPTRAVIVFSHHHAPTALCICEDSSSSFASCLVHFHSSPALLSTPTVPASSRRRWGRPTPLGHWRQGAKCQIHRPLPTPMTPSHCCMPSHCHTTRTPLQCIHTSSHPPTICESKRHRLSCPEPHNPIVTAIVHGHRSWSWWFTSP